MKDGFQLYSDKLKPQLLELYKQTYPEHSTELPFRYYKEQSNCRIERWMLVEKGELTASVLLKHQLYKIADKEDIVSFIKMPLSLGVFNKKYSFSSIRLFKELNKEFPNTILLGMGGQNTQIAKITAAIGWMLFDVHFLFKPLNYVNFLIHFHKFAQIVPRTFRVPNLRFSKKELCYKAIDNLPDAYDDIQLKFTKGINFSLVRSSSVVNSQAPADLGCFKKIEIYKGKEVVGYGTIFISKNDNHRLFGNWTIACVIDYTYDPESINFDYVTNNMEAFSMKEGADVIFINQSKLDDVNTMKQSGWFERSSQFSCGLSKSLY